MKILAIILILFVLVACGGGNEPAASPPTPSIKATAPLPVKKATTVTGGNAVVIHMYQALYGMAPSNALLVDYAFQANNDASTFVKNLTDRFASTSHADLAKLVLDNLGVTPTSVPAVNAKGESEYGLLLDAVKQIFGAFPTMRGQVILNMTNLLVGLERDATYGVAAVAYNSQAKSDLAYSSNAVNSNTISSSSQDVACSVQQNSYGDVPLPPEYFGAFPIPTPMQRLSTSVARGIAFKDDFDLGHHIPVDKECTDRTLFAHNLIIESLSRMQQDGADHVWMYNWGFIDDFSKQSWTMIKSLNRFSDEDTKFIVDEAKKKHMSVYLQWSHLPTDSLNNSLVSDGNYTPESLTKIMNVYRDVLVGQAKYGGEIGLAGIEVDQDCFNINNIWEDPRLMEIYVASIVATVKDVRQVFSGKVVYGGGTMDPRITSIVDSIVIFPFLDRKLTVEQNNNLSVQLVKNAYLKVIKDAKNNYDYFMNGTHSDIPVIWRIQNQSTREYYVKGWNEDCCCPTPDCPQLKLEIDYSTQAIGTEAALEAIKEQTYFPNTIGLYFGTGYWFTDDVRPYQFKSDPTQYSFPNVSQSIRNKPAESIVRYWFGR